MFIGIVIGATATAALYTFRPALAVVPFQWLRRAWAWLNERKGP